MSNGVGRVIALPIALLAAAMVLAAMPGAAAQVTGAVTPKNSAESTVVTLLDTAFNQRKVEEAFAKYAGPYYRQHNPTVADGKQAVIDALRQWLPGTPGLHYEFKHLYSDGDRVIVHSLVTVDKADRGKAVVDIFRLEHGKVVEHWDVAQAVPDKALNDNTMF
jgi:predicted SnoaL-like aldol condensation-catalyzing enzyme